MTLLAARLLVAILFACAQCSAASIPVVAADAVVTVPSAAAAFVAAEAEGRRRMPHDNLLRRQDEDRDAPIMHLLAKPEPPATNNLHGTVIVGLRNVNKAIACVHNSGLIVNIRAEADMCRNRFFIGERNSQNQERERENRKERIRKRQKRKKLSPRLLFSLGKRKFRPVRNGGYGDLKEDIGKDKN
jgi:hypothetical protein